MWFFVVGFIGSTFAYFLHSLGFFGILFDNATKITIKYSLIKVKLNNNSIKNIEEFSNMYHKKNSKIF